MKKAFLSRFLLLMGLACFTTNMEVIACTRVVYQGPNGTVITARSMDWRGDIPANLWVFPRGIERNGMAGNNSVEWKSKYGSVVTSSWNIASSDGMNEKGLAGNLLWLVESKYPDYIKDGDQKGLAVSLWLQYALDNFSTVAEAVEAYRKESFVVVSSFIPETTIYATLHLSLSDASGDNAILEYIDGKLVIHHGKNYIAMTNSPTFDEQLAIVSYWKNIPGTIMLPGTNRAADRFVRASYYINAIPKTDNIRIALAGAFSVIRNCSVPYGISSETEPNISSTQWRTVADHKNRIYYFENVLSPNVVYVEFAKLNFNENSPVRMLSLENNENFSGECSMNFKTTKPFEFVGL